MWPPVYCDALGENVASSLCLPCRTIDYLADVRDVRLWFFFSGFFSIFYFIVNRIRKDDFFIVTQNLSAIRKCVERIGMLTSIDNFMSRCSRPVCEENRCLEGVWCCCHMSDFVLEHDKVPCFCDCLLGWASIGFPLKEARIRWVGTEKTDPHPIQRCFDVTSTSRPLLDVDSFDVTANRRRAGWDWVSFPGPVICVTF